MSMAAALPVKCTLPRDHDDGRYVLSFDVSNSDCEMADAANFFDAFGFVVIKGVFDDHDCEQTRDTMWSIIERNHQGFDR